jgi:hypothetical protein
MEKDIKYDELIGAGSKDIKSLADMVREEVDKDKGNRIDSVDELKKEIEKYNRNEKADFSNVNWGKVVKDKDFTEDMMTMFQVQVQLYYEDYIKTHKVSDEMVRKMYYDFIGVFMLEWLPLKDRKRIFSEIFEEE